MHQRVLKEPNTELAIPLFILFRKTLEYEQIPTAWKKGQIIPIFKKGDESSVSNYRPVSLTSVISKVMETLVRNNIMEHLLNEKLLADAQHGFVSGRSCVTQLIETIEEWTQMLDKGNSVDAVYLDFRKAVDTVADERLLIKLKGYGVNGKVLSWVKAFLTDRRQKVLVNQSQSYWATVTSGISQGSVLGPLLFIIFINDLPDCVKSAIKIFADTKIYREIKDQSDIKQLQDDIDSLKKWSRDW